MDGHTALPKNVPAFGPVATSAMENTVPPFEASEMQTTPLSPAVTASPTESVILAVTVPTVVQLSEGSTVFMFAALPS
ncbi:MAG: hypothetical protein QOJ71_2798 [Actinomycetota bacterium]|nr:hypothetical protein [Actinomycetota bacterium]